MLLQDFQGSESGHRLKVYTTAHSMEAEATDTPGSMAGPEPPYSIAEPSHGDKHQALVSKPN